MKRVFCLLLALLMLCSIGFVACDEEEQEPPKFVPPPFDPGAVVGTPDLPNAEELGYSELDAKGVYQFAICGAIYVVDGKADVWLTNPEKNNVWLKVRVYDKNTGAILGETGLIKPGEYVQTLTFTTAPERGTAISLRIMSYEPETYYSRGEVSLNTYAA